jgi:hypothetical protein
MQITKINNVDNLYYIKSGNFYYASWKKNKKRISVKFVEHNNFLFLEEAGKKIFINKKEMDRLFRTNDSMLLSMIMSSLIKLW